MKQTVDIDAGAARGLVNLARRALPDSSDRKRSDRELGRLIVTWGQQRSAQQPRRRSRGITAGALIAAGVLLVAASWHRTPPLSHRVTTLGQERYLFSDGTTVSLTQGTAIDVEDHDPRQPRVRVQRGEAVANVVHRAGTRWTFSAGPFDVEVVGTSFSLGWDPNDQKLSLMLRQGKVTLRGPMLAAPLSVQAGQRIAASLTSGEVSVAEANAPEPADVAGRRTPLDPPAHPSAAQMTRVAGPAPEVSETARASGASWRALVGRGQFDQVIAQARAYSLAGCFSRCSPEALRALGDAARYSNRPEIAENAYRALRRRCSGMAEGTIAAFLLGRTCEARSQREEARMWYARYLAESPNGELAAEATSGMARVARTR